VTRADGPLRTTIGDGQLREAVLSQEPLVLQPRKGRSIDLGAFAMTVKASEGLTAGAFTLLEATEPPDFGPPMHIHHNADEAFYVLEGEYIIFIEDQETRCPAGSFIYIPSGVRHGFRVGAVASRKLNLYAPGVMVGYFDELAEAIANGAADDERLGAIAMKNGVEVVGPVPEGYL
jgi:mannose-6-phosphate isomerase-like protein (cupin superfamily)